MKNTLHKNQQWTRYLSGYKIGIEFLKSILVKKCFDLRIFCRNQGACGMFSGGSIRNVSKMVGDSMVLLRIRL